MPEVQNVDQAEGYRRHAASCFQLATAASRAEDRLMLLDMAQAWLRLAGQAVKNQTADLVYDLPATEVTRHFVQTRTNADTATAATGLDRA